MCADSGSTNRAYRMPHTSMINITFGEERRDVVLRQQKQSASTGAMPQHPPQTLVFHNRTSRPEANGNAKQQQQPVYKVLQHPRHLESSSPGHQGAARHPQVTRPAQETAVSPIKNCLCFRACTSYTAASVVNGNRQKVRSRNSMGAAAGGM